MDIKSQLYSYYLEILNEISTYDTKNQTKVNLDYQNLDESELLTNIKELNSQMIDCKVSKIISLNNENKEYFQLENYVKKIEYDLKYYLRLNFEYKIQNDALEEKIKIYRMMQEDFEELKEKVRYESGRFLTNERKDNEIIIIRQENAILKKELAKLEKINKLNEILKNDYSNKIKKLENDIQELNKKLKECQELNNKNENDNSNNNNYCENSNSHKLNKGGINININNNENTLSKWFLKHDIENVNSIIPNNIKNKNNLNNFKNLKNLFHKNTICTNKRPANYNIIKSLYMNSNNNSMKNNINSSTMSTINTNNIFTSNYNKIMNNVNQNKIRNTLKTKYGGVKHQRKNNSISMKIEKEEDKSLSLNKYIKSNNDKYMYKSDRKKVNSKPFNKIINFKPSVNYPLSCKHQSASRLNNFKNKKIGLNNNFNEYKTRKNNSALNIRINSK